eukprot:GHVQ01033764.1.p1 GENE.GHVQ01033764.1~~GHVQ01033764.1.p1  ORF type:complete len:368 (+),score=42.78 GHVQ01033764.1:534-1637(+)
MSGVVPFDGERMLCMETVNELLSEENVKVCNAVYVQQGCVLAARLPLEDLVKHALCEAEEEGAITISQRREIKVYCCVEGIQVQGSCLWHEVESIIQEAMSMITRRRGETEGMVNMVRGESAVNVKLVTVKTAIDAIECVTNSVDDLSFCLVHDCTDGLCLDIGGLHIWRGLPQPSDSQMTGTFCCASKATGEDQCYSTCHFSSANGICHSPPSSSSTTTASAPEPSAHVAPPTQLPPTYITPAPCFSKGHRHPDPLQPRRCLVMTRRDFASFDVPPISTAKTLLRFDLPSGNPGALRAALDVLNSHSVNIRMIHSFPISRSGGEQEGVCEERCVRDCLLMEVDGRIDVEVLRGLNVDELVVLGYYS